MKSASNQAISVGQKVFCETTGQPRTCGVSADSGDNRLSLPETRSALGTLKAVLSRGVGDPGLYMYSNSQRSSSALGAARKQGVQCSEGPWQNWTFSNKISSKILFPRAS